QLGRCPMDTTPPAEERILRTALQRFAVEGLAAPLRAVAQDAGVSAGLIIHHFGSREQLLTACDRRALEVTRETKLEVMTGGTGGGLRAAPPAGGRAHGASADRRLRRRCRRLLRAGRGERRDHPEPRSRRAGARTDRDGPRRPAAAAAGAARAARPRAAPRLAALPL